jgi:hypothetical protein
MSIQTIEAEIVSVLQSVPGLTVYDHEPKILKKLPAVTLDFTGFEQERNRMGKRIIRYQWLINLYVSLNKDAGAAMNELKAKMMDIIAAFRAVPTLNGKAVDADIERGGVQLLTEKERPQYLCQFQFYAREGE